MGSNSCKLTIFEGPDGAGKSTAARDYAHMTNAMYVHFPAMPRVTSGLARMYVEAMMPAVLGHQDVVFDRSWLSEKPYGDAFRDGRDRLGNAQRRMLERLAMRCDTRVVRCLPHWEVVLHNFEKRRADEMLQSTRQLSEVYTAYEHMTTHLPKIDYDYTLCTFESLMTAINIIGCEPHPVSINSAGFFEAGTIIVGETFAERKNQDPWYQAPFISFGDGGCSSWLAKQLDGGGISERHLLWVNADQLMIGNHATLLPLDDSDTKVVALGAKAGNVLEALGVEYYAFDHPQYWKRFYHDQPYPLINFLKEHAK